MATYCVDSNASGANDGGENGSSWPDWADAWESFDSAAGSVSAGDLLLVASDHSEPSRGASTNVDFAGSAFSLIRIISTDKTHGAAAGSYLRGALIANETSNYDFGLSGHVHVSGCDVTLNSGTGTDILLGQNAVDTQRYDDCNFTTTGVIKPGITNCDVRLTNCDLDCYYLFPTGNESVFEMIGCKLTTSTASYGIRAIYSEVSQRFSCCDFSDVTATKLIDGHEAIERCVRHFLDCELSGALTVDDTTGRSSIMKFERCTNGPVSAPGLGITKWMSAYGNVDSDSGRFRTGGASDGETPHSFAMVGSSRTDGIYGALESPPITRWVDAGSQTLTIFVAGGASLDDNEFWIEVCSPNETANPNQTSLGRFQTKRPTPQATGIALSTDAVSSWSGTGVGTLQKISVSINPTEPGPVVIKCFLGAATTVYVDPKIEIT